MGRQKLDKDKAAEQEQDEDTEQNTAAQKGDKKVGNDGKLLLEALAEPSKKNEGQTASEATTSRSSAASSCNSRTCRSSR